LQAKSRNSTLVDGIIILQ